MVVPLRQRKIPGFGEVSCSSPSSSSQGKIQGWTFAPYEMADAQGGNTDSEFFKDWAALFQILRGRKREEGRGEGSLMTLRSLLQPKLCCALEEALLILLFPFSLQMMAEEIFAVNRL